MNPELVAALVINARHMSRCVRANRDCPAAQKVFRQTRRDLMNAARRVKSGEWK